MNDIEKSITKKFHKTLFVPFVKSIKKYELISGNDKIAVCISGGKDSMLLAKLLEELKKHKVVKFDLEYIVMDPGYTDEVLKKIKYNLNLLNINAHIFKTDIFQVSNKLNEESPCYLCARMRRGHLYNKALELGCNKIALGHHFDDVLETIMLNMLYAGTYSSMMPKLKSDNFKPLELIRPMYLVHEENIIAWANYNNLEFIDCACSFTKRSQGKRKEVRELIELISKKDKNIKQNIFKSSENVNLNTIISYKKDKEEYNFLSDY